MEDTGGKEGRRKVHEPAANTAEHGEGRGGRQYGLTSGVVNAMSVNNVLNPVATFIPIPKAPGVSSLLSGAPDVLPFGNGR